MIELRNVKKSYFIDGKEIHALKKIDLKVEAGEIFGIIGYSGAGKSTLVKLLNTLERPDSGEVIVDGVAINTLQGKTLRTELQKIGMIFQHFNLLWSRTVISNVMLPLEIAGVNKKEAKIKAAKLLELVGLQDKANAYPAQLSGGQKQRVGIARALVNDPKVLLCDEATSALDPQTTKEILELLVKINKQLKLSIIMISHEMEAVKKICHKIAVLDNGEIAEVNTTTEIFRNPKASITRKFVGLAHSNDLEATILNLKELFKDDTLIKLTFSDGLSSQPIISEVLKEVEVKLSILNGAIDYLGENDIGLLIIKISNENKDEFLKSIEHYQVESEVL